jgi:hypothetical protein
MNTKYLIVVAVMTAMLVGATALASTDSAFAGGKKKYEKSQATAQTNACGNGEMPLNVFCSNTESQIQGDENQVAITSQQAAGEQTAPPMNGPVM